MVSWKFVSVLVTRHRVSGLEVHLLVNTLRAFLFTSFQKSYASSKNGGKMTRRMNLYKTLTLLVNCKAMNHRVAALLPRLCSGTMRGIIRVTSTQRAGCISFGYSSIFPQGYRLIWFTFFPEKNRKNVAMALVIHKPLLVVHKRMRHRKLASSAEIMEGYNSCTVLNDIPVCSSVGACIVCATWYNVRQ